MHEQQAAVELASTGDGLQRQVILALRLAGQLIGAARACPTVPSMTA
jgi:hypothetical protein